MVRWRDIAAITGEGPDKWFSRVCYRRVNCTRDEFTQNRFVEFCKQTIGAKYEISYSKLTRDKSTDKFKVKSQEDVMNLLR